MGAQDVVGLKIWEFAGERRKGSLFSKGDKKGMDTISRTITTVFRVFLGALFFTLCFFILMLSESWAGDDRGLISRQPDPLLISGEKLSNVIGLNPESFGLYALKNGTLVPIPFQVDQKDEEGSYILTDINDEKEIASQPFDENDELVFMAKDLGDHCSPELYPTDWRRGIEIEVTDPLNNTKGWSYLFAFDQLPVRSERAYTRYLLPTEGRDVPDTNVYSIIFPPVEQNRAHATRGLIVKKTAGGSGENFVDRLKTRVKFEFLFSLIKLNFSEDNVGCELLAYKEGPVRIFRRFKTFIPLGFGLKSPGYISDMYYFETGMSSPMEVAIPFRFGSVFSSVTMRIGFDYLPLVSGSQFYNSLNLDGFLIDWVTAPAELDMKAGESEWNLFTGEPGAIMRRDLKFGMAKKYWQMDEYFLDDAAEPDPPEAGSGTFGHTYRIWDVTDLKRGDYQLEQHFFILPNFKWGDQFEYMKIHDHPLRVETTNLESP